MKAGGGRSKGNAFERNVAKQIVEAFCDFTGIDQGDCFRTPLSGGHRFAKKTDPGDLVISPRLQKLFPFHVECKFHKVVNLHELFVPVREWKKSWQFSQWLDQVHRAAGDKRHPLLVFRANNRDTLCALPGFYPLVVDMKPTLLFRYRHEEWHVVRFDALLQRIVSRLQEEAKDNAELGGSDAGYL